MQRKKLRVLIADDHKVVREGLCSLFDNEPDLEVVAEAADGRTALRLANELKPDIVVMDLGMPELNGIEATRQLTAEDPDIKVIALSIHSDRRFVIEALKAGAAGYLVKDCAFEELVRAITAVALKGSYLSPEITGVLVDDVIRKPAPDSSHATQLLSGREREVLQLLAEGRSAKEIAGRLSISVQTVNTHRQHIMKKLDLASVAELTKFAIREGLTTVER